MMVKVGNFAVINMKGLDRISVTPIMDKRDRDMQSFNRYGSGLMGWRLDIKYVDTSNTLSEVSYELDNAFGLDVESILKEVASQLKEVEIETATQLLESTIRNSGEPNG